LRVSDGSIIRGEIKNADTIALRTDYGRLVYPVADIVRISIGNRLSPEQAREIESAIASLDSDDFDKRTGAQNKLESFGFMAITALQTASQSAAPEARSRIDKVLKKALGKSPKTQLEDSVRTKKFEVSGALEIQAFKLSTKLGELTIKIEDVQSILWLNGGAMKTMTLAAIESLKDWQDTGIDVVGGDNISFQCSGEINLFGSSNAGPAGATNWNSQPFLVGAVIGKIGLSGAPFLIGQENKIQATGAERLYVKIFSPENFLTSDNLNQSSGNLQLKIATGLWADEFQPLNVPNQND